MYFYWCSRNRLKNLTFSRLYSNYPISTAWSKYTSFQFQLKTYLMRKRILIALSILFVFGLFGAVFALSGANACAIQKQNAETATGDNALLSPAITNLSP